MSSGLAGIKIRTHITPLHIILLTPETADNHRNNFTCKIHTYILAAHLQMLQKQLELTQRSIRSVSTVCPSEIFRTGPSEGMAVGEKELALGLPTKH